MYVKTLANRVLIETVVYILSLIIVQPTQVLSCIQSEFYGLGTRLGRTMWN
jgi:hypothetical protein